MSDAARAAEPRHRDPNMETVFILRQYGRMLRYISEHIAGEEGISPGHCKDIVERCMMRFHPDIIATFLKWADWRFIAERANTSVRDFHA